LARSGREHAGIVARTRDRLPVGLVLTSLTRLCTEVAERDVRNRIFYI
jgi:hypothetical protein